MKKRRIWEKIQKHLHTDETIVITGSRRVGKTTTIKWCLEQIGTKNSYYFDLENVANRDLFITKNYDNLIQEFKNLGLDLESTLYIAIDEIQYVSNLPSIVKYLQDNYKIKFLLSGSSSYYLKNLFSESLSGRKIIFELYPLSFSEFLDFKNVDYQINTKLESDVTFNQQSYTRLSSYYNEYIEFGGLPQVANTDSIEQKIQLLEDIYSSYINLDVQSLSDFKSLSEFRKLVRLLASRVGSKINTSELASILGISRITVEAYIEFMIKTYLIRSVPIFSKSKDVLIRKQEKIYFIDNGILNINADLSSGAKFENAIASQLAYRKSLSYFETRNVEVDFIIDNAIAIEVKETPTKSDLQQLIKRVEKIDIPTCILVGKNENAGFVNYTWGGLVE